MTVSLVLKMSFCASSFQFPGDFILPLVMSIIIANESQYLEEKGMFNLKMSSPLSTYYKYERRIDHPHLLRDGNQKSSRHHTKFTLLKYSQYQSLRVGISLPLSTNLTANPNHRNDTKFKLQAFKENHVLFGGTYLHPTNIYWVFTLYQAQKWPKKQWTSPEKVSPSLLMTLYFHDLQLSVVYFLHQFKKDILLYLSKTKNSWFTVVNVL